MTAEGDERFQDYRQTQQITRRFSHSERVD